MIENTNENLNEEEKQLDDALDIAKSYLILADSEAGRNLIKSLKEQIEGLISVILANYKNSSHVELINQLARLEVLRDIINELIYSKEKVDILIKELKK